MIKHYSHSGLPLFAYIQRIHVDLFSRGTERFTIDLPSEITRAFLTVRVYSAASVPSLDKVTPLKELVSAIGESPWPEFQRIHERIVAASQSDILLLSTLLGKEFTDMALGHMLGSEVYTMRQKVHSYLYGEVPLSVALSSFEEILEAIREKNQVDLDNRLAVLNADLKTLGRSVSPRFMPSSISNKFKTLDRFEAVLLELQVEELLSKATRDA